MPSRPDDFFEAPYLFRTRSGSVLRCACCGRLEVVFEQGLLSLTDVDFTCLLKTIARLGAEMEQHGLRSRCRFVAQVGPKLTQLECGLHQVQALEELLCGAAAVVELHEMLDVLDVDLSGPLP